MLPVNRVVTPPANEPITIQEVKDSAYAIDNPLDDHTIRTIIIPYARALVEKLSRKAMMTQTRVQLYDYMPTHFDVLYSPLQEVTSLTYEDDNEVIRAILPSEYRVDTYSQPAKITSSINGWWPVASSASNSVVLTYVAGFGNRKEDVPWEYRGAMILLATHFYHNRGICAVAPDVMDAVENLINIAGKLETYA